jgi:hypothetical protein
MKLRRISIVLLFRGLWLILALALILSIISRNIYTARQLVYQVDFKDSSTRDYRGWYPDTRVSYDVDDQKLAILGEPIYMKVYVPVKFDTLALRGSWSTASTTVQIALKQADDSWSYKVLDQKDWSVNFDLHQAKIYRNQIELMISIPDYAPGQNIYLDNNMQMEFKR